MIKVHVDGIQEEEVRAALADMPAGAVNTYNAESAIVEVIEPKYYTRLRRRLGLRKDGAGAGERNIAGAPAGALALAFPLPDQARYCVNGAVLAEAYSAMAATLVPEATYAVPDTLRAALEPSMVPAWAYGGAIWGAHNAREALRLACDEAEAEALARRANGNSAMAAEALAAALQAARELPTVEQLRHAAIMEGCPEIPPTTPTAEAYATSLRKELAACSAARERYEHSCSKLIPACDEAAKALASAAAEYANATAEAPASMAALAAALRSNGKSAKR